MTLDELRALAKIGRGGYHVFGGEYAQMAVTLEDAEFLYALVGVTKPAWVLEFGTGLGVSARFISDALIANGMGHLETHEPAQWLAVRAEAFLLGWPATVNARHPSTLGRAHPDLVFIDSGYDRREADIAEWLGNGYQGLLCVHDAGRDYAALREARGVYLPGVDGLWLGRGG